MEDIQSALIKRGRVTGAKRDLVSPGFAQRLAKRRARENAVQKRLLDLSESRFNEELERFAAKRLPAGTQPNEAR